MAKSKVVFSADLLMAWLCSRDQMDAKIVAAKVDYDRGQVVFEIEGYDVPKADECVVEISQRNGPFGGRAVTTELKPREPVAADYGV